MTKDRRGVILLSVIIILLTIALIGASLMAFLFSVNLTARAAADKTKAFYLAEAGMAQAVSKLRSPDNTLVLAKETFGPVSLGDGTYKVEIDHLQSVVTSVGEVNGIKSKLQLQFKSY